MSCSPFSTCQQWSDTRKVAVIRDKSGGRAEFRYKNPNANLLHLHEVDGCLMPSKTDEKCDFLLLNCEKKKAFFIELKGSDLLKATSQIRTAIDFLKKDLAEFSFHARVSLNKHNVPASRTNELTKFKIWMEDSLGGSFKSGSSGLEEIER